MTKNQLMQIRKTKDFLNVLKSEYQYTLSRQESSHMIFTCENRPTLSIPNERELSDGTKRNLVKLVLGQSYYTKES